MRRVHSGNSLLKSEDEGILEAPKITGNEDIADLFSIFHDGDIIFRSLIDGELSIEAEVLYLAERISRTFERFFVTLSGVQGLRFSPWWDEAPEDGVQHLEDIERIFAQDLGILRGGVKEGEIEIGCECDDQRRTGSGLYN